jgi:Divergent InlB B-repeat domain
MRRRLWLLMLVVLATVGAVSCVGVLGDFDQAVPGDASVAGDAGSDVTTQQDGPAVDDGPVADTQPTNDAPVDAPAEAAPTLYTLTVTISGNGVGTVKTADGSIACPGTCTTKVVSGTKVTLTSAAGAASTFVAWTGGGCSGTAATCDVTVGADTKVDAAFGLNNSLIVTKGGSGAGTVTSVPAGINCGTSCSAVYPPNTNVTLTAAPSTGSNFSGWVGCSGVDGGVADAGLGTCTVNVNAAIGVTANFTLQQFPVTVTKAGNGAGTVTSTPAGISCGATCSAPFDYGSQVTLTAVASTGSTFTGWSGNAACTGTGTCVLTPTAAAGVTATFTLQQFTLTVTPGGNGTGTIVSTPSGINCGATCAVAFDYNTPVTLTPASAGPGSQFASWGGDCTGSGTCVVTMTAARNVTANFTLMSETLTVTKNGTGTGAVTSSPAGINCGATCVAGFNYGTAVTLTATPVANTIFAGWSGGGCGGVGTCVVNMIAANAVTATFTAIIPTRWDARWSTAGVAFTNGDLSISGNTAATKNVRTISGKSTGKWYWEITATGGDGVANGGGIGIAESAMPNTALWIGNVPSGLSFGYAANASYFMTWANAILNGAPPVNSYVKSGIVYTFALDMTTGAFWAGQDGTWYNAGNPSTGVNAVVTKLSGTVYPGVTFYASSINAFTANFGGSPFKFAVPSGFNPGFYDIPAQWDPTWSLPGVTFTNNNVSISGNSANTTNVRTNVGRSAGKYYWEILATGGDGATNAGGLGLLESVMPNNANYIGSVPSGMSFGYGTSNSSFYTSWVGSVVNGTPPAGSAVKSGIVYMFALDAAGGNLWVGQGGLWYNSGSPGGAGAVLQKITGTMFPGVTFYPASIDSYTANFGGAPFTYGAPPGFGAGFY